MISQWFAIRWGSLQSDRFYYLERKNRWEVHIVGGHNEKANIDALKMILKEFGKDASLSLISSIEKMANGMQFIRPRFRNSWGWLPKKNYKDSVKKTIAWYLGHNS